MAKSSFRFHVPGDDELRKLHSSSKSNCPNTENTVRYATRMFKNYLHVINTDLDTVVKSFSNRELDDVLQKFYVGARQQNGSRFSRSTLIAIRFGLQRHLLETKNVDIVNGADFAASSRIFKRFGKTLKNEVTSPKEPISPSDMDLIQASLNDLDDPRDLQDKVFLDVMLNLYILGKECLRDMTRDSFEICEDKGTRYITLSNKDSTHRKAEGQVSGIMIPTYGPRCPVANFLLYMDKLHPKCMAFWQKPKTKREVSQSSGPWYSNMPIGKNTIGSKMKTISARAGTSRIYTNKCLTPNLRSLKKNTGKPLYGWSVVRQPSKVTAPPGTGSRTGAGTVFVVMNPGPSQGWQGGSSTQPAIAATPAPSRPANSHSERMTFRGGEGETKEKGHETGTRTDHTGLTRVTVKEEILEDSPMSPVQPGVELEMPPAGEGLGDDPARHPPPALSRGLGEHGSSTAPSYDFDLTKDGVEENDSEGWIEDAPGDSEAASSFVQLAVTDKQRVHPTTENIASTAAACTYQLGQHSRWERDDVTQEKGSRRVELSVDAQREGRARKRPVGEVVEEWVDGALKRASNRPSRKDDLAQTIAQAAYEEEEVGILHDLQMATPTGPSGVSSPPEETLGPGQPRTPKSTVPFPFSPAQERELAAWYRDNPRFYNRQCYLYRLASIKNSIISNKAKQYRDEEGKVCTGGQLSAWMRSMQTLYEKLANGTGSGTGSGTGTGSGSGSGSGLHTLTERELWIKQAFHFLSGHIFKSKGHHVVTIGTQAGHQVESLVSTLHDRSSEMACDMIPGTSTDYNSTTGREESNTKTMKSDVRAMKRICTNLLEKGPQQCPAPADSPRSSELDHFAHSIVCSMRRIPEERWNDLKADIMLVVRSYSTPSHATSV